LSTYNNNQSLIIQYVELLQLQVRRQFTSIIHQILTESGIDRLHCKFKISKCTRQNKEMDRIVTTAHIWLTHKGTLHLVA
jgi:hypothetical protein